MTQNPTEPVTPNDLEINTAGMLTPVQQRRFILLRAAEHAFGALLVMLFFALVVHMTRLYPEPVVLLVAFVVILIAALALFVIHIRPALGSQLQSVKGMAARRVLGEAGLQPLYCVTIGETLFYVSEAQFREISDDDQYEVYFLPRPARVGGGTWLSARKLT